MKLAIFGACSRQRSTSPFPGLVASILMSAAPILAAAGEAGRASEPNQRAAFHAAGPLDASQLQAIQHAGRSVLTAKRGYEPSTEQAALRDELKGLSAAIDTALAPRPGNVIVLDSAVAPASVNAGKLRAGDGRGRALSGTGAEDDHFGELRARLASVHERRRKIEKNTRRTKSNPDKPQTQHLVAKVAELGRETDAALNTQGDERITKLRHLRERLQVQGGRETKDTQFEQPAEGTGKAAPREAAGAPSRITPTISTLVRHR